MATINQLVSELAHSLKQPDSVPVRKALKLEIIHARNALIRQSFEHHGYVDKVLQQKFKVEIEKEDDYVRTSNKVPKPVRLTNNNPFHSVTINDGGKLINIPYIKQDNVGFYNQLPGMKHIMSYDYINGYIYITNLTNENIENIFIESVFEFPQILELDEEVGETSIDTIDDDDEYLISEDMVGNIKKLILETFNPQVVRDTNEPTPVSLVQ